MNLWIHRMSYVLAAVQSFALTEKTELVFTVITMFLQGGRRRHAIDQFCVQTVEWQQTPRLLWTCTEREEQTGSLQEAGQYEGTISLTRCKTIYCLRFWISYCDVAYMVFLPGFKGWMTAKWRHFINIADCCICFNTRPPLSPYSDQILLGLYFLEKNPTLSHQRDY